MNSTLAIPAYLQETYWWAYIHPKAVSLFERQWLVNLILWGNFSRLRDAALDELGAERFPAAPCRSRASTGTSPLTSSGASQPDGQLDVVDILPIQLANLRGKLPAGARAELHHRDSTDLGFADASYDQAILFFLLHEQPEAVRRQTVSEALRVLKPGGKLVIVDYHQPARGPSRCATCSGRSSTFSSPLRSTCGRTRSAPGSRRASRRPACTSKPTTAACTRKSSSRSRRWRSSRRTW